MLDITIGMIKKVIYFNGKTNSFYNMICKRKYSINISIKFFNKSTISFVV